MGIYATQHPGNIIVSPDKDMRQIPGKLYNLETTQDITAEEGAQWHYIQTLAGDQTDGYSGVPGIGVKRAETLFNKEGYNWSTVVTAFEDKGLTEDDALLNARLARILTIDNYDTKDKNPSFGHLPLPITTEQDFKMRVIEDNLRKNYDKKEDVITVFLALQRQNFALSNALKKLLENAIIY